MSFGVLFCVLIIIYIAALAMIHKLHRKHGGKTLRILHNIMLICFVLWLISFVIVESLIIYSGHQDKELQGEYAIILGAGLKGEVPNISLASRLETATEYLVQRVDVNIIVSGGQGEGETISEAEAMKRYLVSKGIAADRITKEDKSTSTLENLKFSKNILDAEVGQVNHKVILITSDYHIYRTKIIADRLGLELSVLPAKTPLTVYVNYCIREYFAILNTLPKLGVKPHALAMGI